MMASGPLAKRPPHILLLMRPTPLAHQPETPTCKPMTSPNPDPAPGAIEAPGPARRSLRWPAWLASRSQSRSGSRSYTGRRGASATPQAKTTALPARHDRDRHAAARARRGRRGAGGQGAEARCPTLAFTGARRQADDPRGLPGQDGAAQPLGDMVRAVPQGDAGARRAAGQARRRRFPGRRDQHRHAQPRQAQGLARRERHHHASPITPTPPPRRSRS